jgi:hypothetical protein
LGLLRRILNKELSDMEIADIDGKSKSLARKYN